MHQALVIVNYRKPPQDLQDWAYLRTRLFRLVLLHGNYPYRRHIINPEHLSHLVNMSNTKHIHLIHLDHTQHIQLINLDNITPNILSTLVSNQNQFLVAHT